MLNQSEVSFFFFCFGAGAGLGASSVAFSPRAAKNRLFSSKVKSPGMVSFSVVLLGAANVNCWLAGFLVFWSVK